MTDQSQLKDLERRLAEAKGALNGPEARELSASVFGRGGYEWLKCWLALQGDLSAAVALVERVLKHHEINLNLYRDRDNEWNWCATLTSPDEPDEGEDPDRWWALAPHPHSALALCLACVRALIAQVPNQPEKERT